MTDGVTHVVNGDDPHFLDGAPWIRIVPLRTPTLPPATHTNCYIIGESDGVRVIDPASPYPEEQARLAHFVRNEGLHVREILLTHHHVDHVSGAMQLAAETGAPIAAHAVTQERLRGVVDITRTIDEGDILGGLVARFTPGHAPGHLCFVDSAGRAIVAGDMLASVGTIIIEPADGGDMALYLASLARLRGEVDGGATRLLPAHGPPVVDGGARIDFYVAHRLEREGRVLAALGAAPATLEQLVPAAYPDVPPMIYGLAARSLLAHLLKLEGEGRARRAGGERWTRA
jgi:glyoxylase-like metal-dependent hydrolase (beta-lactamase superfamily II)